MIKIGIIGCGWIAEKAHITTVQEIPDAIVYGIYDDNHQKAKEVAGRNMISKIYNNIYELLESEIDAVIICTPNITHSYYCNMALKYNKHVLCEKPIALNSRTYLSTVKLARDRNKLLISGFVNRYRNDIIELSNVVEQFNLGKLNYIKAKWLRRDGIPRPGTWITNKKMAGGGVLVDLGSHVLDIVGRFMKNPEIELINVDCVRQSHGKKGAKWCDYDVKQGFDFDVETYIKFKISYLKRIYAELELSWDSDIMEDCTIFDLYYDLGHIRLNTIFGFSNNYSRQYDMLEIDSESEIRRIIFDRKRNEAMNAFKNQTSYFVKAIKENRYNKVYPNDALFTIKTIEMIYKLIGSVVYD